jgi:hypothetical protein
LRDSGTVAAAVLANLGLQLGPVREEVRKAAGEAHG